MTLVDSIKVFYRVYSYLLRKYYGKNIVFEEFYKRFCDDSLSVRGKDEYVFWEEFKKLYAPINQDEIKLMPGGRELLHRIKKSGGMIIVLSGRGVKPGIIEKELAFLGIRDLVDHFETLSQDKMINPSNPFDKKDAVRRLRIKYPGECVMIGDYMGDMYAGKQNGCITIGVTTGCKSPDKLKKAGADYVANDLWEVIRYLEDNKII